MSSAWFLSDLHLKDVNERNGVVLVRFLNDLLKSSPLPSHLFLLGDLFDLWVGSSDFFYQRYRAIIDPIARLKDRGVEIHYFEGNHDLHLKTFWETKYSIPVHTRAEYFEIQGTMLRLEHGDEINLEDKAYLRLRRFLRLTPLEKLATTLPGELWQQVGDQASQLSRRFSAERRERESESLRSVIRKHAERSYDQRAFDFLIAGHMHIEDVYEFQRGSRVITSVNLGSWFEGPRALELKFDSSPIIKWHRWK